MMSLLDFCYWLADCCNLVVDFMFGLPVWVYILAFVVLRVFGDFDFMYLADVLNPVHRICLDNGGNKNV